MTNLKNEVLTTPKGRAIFPWLTNADIQFDSEGKFHTKLECEKTECEKIISAINGEIAKQVKAQHELDPNKKITYANKPYSISDDGKCVFKLQTKFKPNLLDNNMKALANDVQIWKDSVVRITFETYGYNQAVGIGCKLYPLTVQVLELVTGSPNAKLGDLKVEPDVEPKEKQEINL